MGNDTSSKEGSCVERKAAERGREGEESKERPNVFPKWLDNKRTATPELAGWGDRPGKEQTAGARRCRL